METSFKKHFTRETASAGIKIPLLNADQTPSQDWIRIRSILSDEFRGQDLLEKQKVAQLYAELTESDLDDDAKKAEMVNLQEAQSKRLLASLIAEWSFSEECNEENKIVLLTEAPQIRDAINKIAADRKAFFRLPSES